MKTSAFEPIEGILYNCEACGRPGKVYHLGITKGRGNYTMTIKVCSRCAIDLVNNITLGLRK